MNCSVYLFGDFGKGYTQYPDDYAQSIFQNFYAKSTAGTQITIHRNGNLMYYGYIRKLEGEKADKQYIGFCVLLNGVMLTKVGNLFSLFEETITNLVVNGHILEFNDRGDIVSKVDKLYEKQQEVNRATEMIRNGILQLDTDCKKLPPVSYGLANNESKSFSADDDHASIVEATCTYSYTYIYKPGDYNTQSLSSYKGTLNRLNKEKQEITDKYNKLSEEYQKVLQQKKQYRKVVLLCLLVVVCGISLLGLKYTLEGAKHDLNYAEKKNNALKSDVERLKTNNLNLQNSVEREQSNRQSVESELSDLKSSIDTIMPIIITNIEIANTYHNDAIETEYGDHIYSDRTMYLTPRITYRGIKVDEEIMLNIKLYTPSGLNTGSTSPDGYTYSNPLTILKGENIKALGGWGSSTMGQWTKGSYRLEIWYDDICLKTKTFTVY